jgi:hypothetical protein
MTAGAGVAIPPQFIHHSAARLLYGIELNQLLVGDFSS